MRTFKNTFLLAQSALYAPESGVIYGGAESQMVQYTPNESEHIGVLG